MNIYSCLPSGRSSEKNVKQAISLAISVMIATFP